MSRSGASYFALSGKVTKTLPGALRPGTPPAANAKLTGYLAFWNR